MPEGELIGTQISNKLLREGKKANRLKQKWSSCNPTLTTLQSFAAYMSVTVSELLDTTLSEADMEKLLEERLHLPKHALSKVPDDKDLPESV